MGCAPPSARGVGQGDAYGVNEYGTIWDREGVMADPRAENCRALKVSASGLVEGVELVYHPVPSAMYELVRVELLDEQTARGETVAACTVLDRGGLETGEKVWLAWAWPELKDGKLLPGNVEGKHMIGSGYDPTQGPGPLALYVGDAAGNPISDIIGGLGLPWKRHVSYKAVWRERVEPSNGPGGDEGSEGSGSDAGAVLAALGRIAGVLERLAAHLGA